MKIPVLSSAASGVKKIGRFQASNHFTGRIDDVRIYSRALTPAEIARLAGARAADSSGNANHGALVAMDPETGWVPGQSGGALGFDGTDDMLDVPDSTLWDFAGKQASIGFWFKSAGTDFDNTILEHASSPEGWFIDIEENDGPTAGKLEMVHLGTDMISLFSTQAYNDGAWHHAVFTLDGATARLYVDGRFDNSDAYSGLTDRAIEDLSIGHYSLAGSDDFFFDGSLDDVRLYNRALSEEEIEKIYFASQPIRLNKGLVGHWRLDESGNVSTAADSAGANDGTLTNFPADPSASWVTGRVGGTLAFDGADDYVDVGSDASLDDLGPASYCAWIFPTGWGEASFGYIYSKNSTSRFTVDGNGDGTDQTILSLLITIRLILTFGERSMISV